MTINYNQRYQQGYMTDFSDLYEACRLTAVQEVLHSKRIFPTTPHVILDIACGQGRYIPFLKNAFPNCQIIGMDISLTGLVLAQQAFSAHHFATAMSEALPLSDKSVDMIFSIETLEHVFDVRATIQAWSRMLKPGGKILMTTPCANKFSLEWTLMYLSNGLESSTDGYGRFRRDEPGHLRRLNSNHVRELFAEAGLKIIEEYFRTHLFTTIAHDSIPYRYRKSRKLKRLAYWLASLDWLLFRRLPNGASMLVVAEKI